MSSIVDVSEVLLECGLSASVTDEERAIANQSIIKAEGVVKSFLHYDPIQKTHTEFYPQTDTNQQHRQGIWEVQGDQAILRRAEEAATRELQLIHIPIRDVTSVHIDFDGRSGTKSGAFGSETLKTEGVDFWANYDSIDSDGDSVCMDGILRSLGSWPVTPGTVKVVYVAGYTEAEFHGQDTSIDVSPIWEAALNEACKRLRKVMALKKQAGAGFVTGTLKSEKLGDYAYTLDSSPASTEIAIGGTSSLSMESKSLLSPYIHWSFVF